MNNFLIIIRDVLDTTKIFWVPFPPVIWWWPIYELGWYTLRLRNQPACMSQLSVSIMQRIYSGCQSSQTWVLNSSISSDYMTCDMLRACKTSPNGDYLKQFYIVIMEIRHVWLSILHLVPFYASYVERRILEINVVLT